MRALIRLALSLTLAAVVFPAIATASEIDAAAEAAEAAEKAAQSDEKDAQPDRDASAQTAAEARALPVQREEITVTGGLIQGSLMETPESVSVWGSDTLTDAGMRELQDVYNQTANAYQIANGEGFGVRGLNQGGIGTGGSGELGSYYADGVAMTGFTKRVGPMQLWDVEQVEILRGPQTTNVGRNAMAGAVVVQTKDPVQRKENTWQLGLGSESTWEAFGMVNAPVTEHSAFRFTAESWNTDGFVTNPTRGEDDYDARDNLTLRGKYLMAPGGSDDLRMVVTAQYAETRRGNDIVDLARPDDRENLSNLDAFEENDSLLLSLGLNWRFSDQWNLRSITSILDAEYRRFDDDDQGPGGGDSFRGRSQSDRNWAQDFRFEFTGKKVRGVAGLYYTEVEFDGVTDALVGLVPIEVGIPLSLTPFYPELLLIKLDNPYLIDTTNFALFNRWEWNIDDRWSAFAGFRWDLEEQESVLTASVASLSPLPDPTTPGLPPQIAGAIATVNAILASQLGTTVESTDTDYEAFLPEFGVSYAWNNSLTSSLFYKRGYRAGGAGLSLTGRQNEFDPEFLDLVELSIRSLSLDGTLTLNGNLYAGLWQDQQVSVQQSNNAFDFLTENAGESEIYGFELEARYRPFQSWDVYASVGFAHTEFTEFETAIQGDLSGNRFTAAPEWTAAIGANYRFGGGWFVHGDVGYEGSRFSNVENDPTLQLDERTLLNLRGGYETAKYSILAYVNNLTDEAYAVTAFRNNDGGKLGKVGAPRQAGVQLRLRF